MCTLYDKNNIILSKTTTKYVFNQRVRHQALKDEKQYFTKATLEKSVSFSKIERCRKFKNRTIKSTVKTGLGLA